MYGTVENFSRPLAVVPIAHSTAATIPAAARAIAPARRGFERMRTSSDPIAACSYSDHRRTPGPTPPAPLSATSSPRRHDWLPLPVDGEGAGGWGSHVVICRT